MSREAILKAATETLQAAGVDNPSREAKLLLDAAVDEKIFTGFVRRRAAREPFARITGKRGFWKHEFMLNEATLEPRPDTETLVEAVLAVFPDKNTPLRLLDIGTGTGCILISLLGEFPNTTGTGTDISTRALEAAKTNAKNSGVAERTAFIKTAWCEGIKGPFDIIVSNPPYIPQGDLENLQPEVRGHDPRVALDGGVDGLSAYRAILNSAPALLAPGGKIFFEVGLGQDKPVAALMCGAGCTKIAMRKDLSGIARVVHTA